MIFCLSDLPIIFILFLAFCRILMTLNQWPSPITYVELIFKNRTNSFSLSHIEKNPIRGYRMSPRSLKGLQYVCVCVGGVAENGEGVVMKLSVRSQGETECGLFLELRVQTVVGFSLDLEVSLEKLPM